MNFVNKIITMFMTYEAFAGDAEGLKISAFFLFINLVIIQSLAEMRKPPR